MLPEEKDKLLGLVGDGERWCQGAEARDARGEAVRYDDPGAAAWDITGGLCLLFGWRRASALFRQLDKHILGPRDSRPPRSPEIASMAALQDFNDRAGTTFGTIAEQLQTMPVWRGKTGSD